MFHLFIKAGADVNQAAWRGGTPLLAAIAGDQVEMVRVLLVKGAERSEKALDLAKRRKVAEIVAMLEKS
jgi:ankyrin repeat protein